MAEEAAGLAEGPLRMRAPGHGYVRFATRRPGHPRPMFGPGIGDKDSHPELLETARAAFALISGSVAANVSDGAGTADRAPVVTIAAWALVHGRTTLVVVRQIRPALNSPAA